MNIKQLHEFETLTEVKQYFKTEKKAIEYYIKQRWPNGVTCTKQQCASKHISHFKDGKRFKCKTCKHIFSYKTGSMFHNTKLPLRIWFALMFDYARQKNGVSSYAIAKEYKIKQRTAHFALQRLRFTFRHENTKTIFGLIKDATVQADEKYLKGKNSNKHGNKKSIGGQGRSKNPDSTPILGFVESTGRIKFFKVPNTNAETITPLAQKNIAKGTTIYTDEWSGYGKLKSVGYKQEEVIHQKQLYVIGNATTNRMEREWAVLGQKMKGTHGGAVTEKHLQEYLNELAFRINVRAISAANKYNIMMQLTTTGYITRWEGIMYTAA